MFLDNILDIISDKKGKKDIILDKKDKKDIILDKRSPI
jgi:hypothetical protein